MTGPVSWARPASDPVLRLAALALLTTTASAQRAPPSARPTSGQRALVVVAGAAVGVGAAVGTGLFVGNLNGQSVPTGVTAGAVAVAFPVGVALGVGAASSRMELAAPDGALWVDTALGVPVGVVAGVVVGVAVAGGVQGVRLLTGASEDYGGAALISGAAAGALTLAVVTAGVASRRVRVAPAALAAPTGEGGAGLRVTVGL